MCLAIPGKVIEINGREALVEYPEETRRAMIGLDDVVVGDFVRVQMGIIMQKISEKDAKLSWEQWKKVS